MRICVVTDSRDPSGVGRHVLDLVANLPRGYEPIVVAPDAPLARWLLREAAARGMETWQLPDADSATQAAAFARRLRVNHVDLVHVHAGIAWEGHELAVAARASGVAGVVRTEHCPYVLTHAHDVEHYDAAIHAASRLIAVSHGVADSFQAAGVKRSLIRVVENGVASRPPRRTRAGTLRRLGLEPDSRLVVTVARMTEQKGHLGLAAALPDVIDAVPKARFVWIGYGWLQADLEAALDRAGTARSVVVREDYDDVPGLLAAADVVAIPSLFEGLPLVALEAMAAARPVVATAVVGLNEAVIDGVTGRLVPVADPKALAAGLIEVLLDRRMASRWGAAGRRRQQRQFTAARMARRTAAVYAEVLEEARAEVAVSAAVGA